jgi:quinol monooxygenase YgiN
MYAAVRRGQAINQGAVDEIVRRVTEGFLPIISKGPGFMAYYVVGTADGGIVTISVFEDQAAAEESNRLAADWIRQNLGPLLRNPPELNVGEVLVHHTS